MTAERVINIPNQYECMNCQVGLHNIFRCTLHTPTGIFLSGNLYPDALGGGMLLLPLVHEQKRQPGLIRAENHIMSVTNIEKLPVNPKKIDVNDVYGALGLRVGAYSTGKADLTCRSISGQENSPYRSYLYLFMVYQLNERSSSALPQYALPEAFAAQLSYGFKEVLRGYQLRPLIF